MRTTEREEDVYKAFNKFLESDIPIDEITYQTIETYKRATIKKWYKSCYRNH
ncbi:hypothetical protein KJ656_07620 [bacterium]|nr:hypothetical protein [bacterium]